MSQVFIEVLGDEKSGYAVQVPPAVEIPYDAYVFLTQKCRAKHDKSKNRYEGIRYNPWGGLAKTLGAGFALTGVQPAQKQQAATAGETKAPTPATNPQGEVKFTVLKERLAPDVAKKLDEKGFGALQEAIVVRGTRKEDEGLRNTMKNKYAATGFKSDEGYLWVLPGANVANAVSIYKELSALRAPSVAQETAQPPKVTPQAPVGAAQGAEVEFKMVGNAVCVSSMAIATNAELLKAVKAQGASYNKSARGMVFPESTTMEQAKTIIGALFKQYGVVEVATQEEDGVSKLLRELESKAGAQIPDKGAASAVIDAWVREATPVQAAGRQVS